MNIDQRCRELIGLVRGQVVSPNSVDKKTVNPFIAQGAKRQVIKVRKFGSSHLITHDADFCAITVASDGFQFANPGYTFFKRLGIAVLFGFPTDFFFSKKWSFNIFYPHVDDTGKF